MPIRFFRYISCSLADKRKLLWANIPANFFLPRRQGKKYCTSRQLGAGKSLHPNRIDIENLPTIVEKQTRLGDWEMNTVMGAIGKEVIVSMVEPASKLSKLAVSKNKTAKAVAQSLIQTLKPFKDYVATLTSDNGTKCVLHEEVSQAIGADFYCEKPSHSWERGLNENANGLLRQNLPKRTAVFFLKQKHIAILEDLLNTRLRKELNYAAPQEAFNIIKGQPCAIGNWSRGETHSGIALRGRKNSP